jgi:hypothetical protein
MGETLEQIADSLSYHDPRGGILITAEDRPTCRSVSGATPKGAAAASLRAARVGE